MGINIFYNIYLFKINVIINLCFLSYILFTCNRFWSRIHHFIIIFFKNILQLFMNKHLTIFNVKFISNNKQLTFSTKLILYFCFNIRSVFNDRQSISSIIKRYEYINLIKNDWVSIMNQIRLILKKKFVDFT